MLSMAKSAIERACHIMSTYKRTHKNLSVESREHRDLLSVTPTPVGDFNLDAQSIAEATDNTWLNGELFFAADDGNGDVELWKSDGTADATLRVADIRTGAQGSLPRDFIAADGRVLFTASTEQHGRELWATDGSEAGMVQLTTNDVSLRGLGPNVVYFRVRRAGDELWQSDGTQEGTVRAQAGTVRVVDTDSRSDKNTMATEINSRLYFIGDDGFHGAELWQIPIESEPTSVPGDANRDGIFNSADLVRVLQRGEYEDQISGNSSWEEGDWNGDGDFTSEDLVLALQSGEYQAAVVLHEMQADDTSRIATSGNPKVNHGSPEDGPWSVSCEFQMTVLGLSAATDH